MGLPLYLAMTAAEMAACPALPRHWGCFFTDAMGDLPPEAMLILTDRTPLQSPAAPLPRCGLLLLDFERPPTEDSRAIVQAVSKALPCPVAAPPGFLDHPDCAVFLPPCPLHIPLAAYLKPWQGREIWLDVTFQQQTITVTRDGAAYGPVTPPDRQGGVFDETLCCQVVTEIRADAAHFTLFDTADTLKRKLARAEALGVSRAVGLHQELAKWA